ncbi:MAG: hypothetical protein AAB116_17340 [Candidatus Poribacteria bacterium]
MHNLPQKEQENEVLVTTESLQEADLDFLIELYLRAENTQEKIAKILDIPRITILDKINNFKKNVENPKNRDFGQDADFSPFLYNIWNLKKADKQTSQTWKQNQ